MHTHILGPEAVEWRGVVYKTILSSDTSGGALSIIDNVSRPDTGPPRHVHSDCDEAFVVLSGEVAFEVEGQLVHRGPGQTAFVPRGAEHSFRVLGHQPARMLTIFSPGGFEAFFAEMAENDYSIPGDMEQIARIGAARNVTFTGPPLEAERLAHIKGGT
ncbi:cupin domain-containing protein [Primorskyibacter aestuariivivens]|uniref:cupin domain-containing protein n=1 Tax=Primorskyibacter aestuariivivens TaxID=1888912 RepID=UPI0023006B19|nr:cupin domain-containing protein [Primorskyibacter aestuariivivens]MDA7430468.1 cupin domain-containing protein [Primorskyibacter aestuariivivens]